MRASSLRFSRCWRLGTRWISTLFALILPILPFCSRSAIPLRLDDPTDFFTNIATRLLKSERNLDLSDLQIYPTNLYTPSVHRLLQVTANIYDCTTNRALGITPEEPYCPSVFRPLFRRVDLGTNSLIVIAAYREVTNTDLADATLAPPMFDLTQPNPPLQAFPAYGTAFMWPEKAEPMVAGVPLIIGARTGFPNFNEFSMQTAVFVSRLLEFRRATPDVNGPVVATNQMYVVGISNNFGLESWNSYSTAYPRALQLITSASMTAVLTNDTGASNVIFSNTSVQAISTLFPSNSWSGWSSVQTVPASMVLPFGATNEFIFLTNSTYLNSPPWFVPQTHIFQAGAGFYVPHWWLNLSTHVLFVLVDTDAHRIVDYVNLNRAEQSVDVTCTLASGNTGTVNPLDYRNPANEWLTNRVGTADSATYGVLNQIQVCLNGTTDWLSFGVDPYAGLDAETAVDSFRYNLLQWSPIYAKDVGKAFYKSNVFYAPFDPWRQIYIHTTWQANDPLMHYQISDLVDWTGTNRVDFVGGPLANLGRINSPYAPWPANYTGLPQPTDGQIAVKDPGIARSDDWGFPTNQQLTIDWLGAVHRGTPWQTIFLKSTNFLLSPSGLLNWARWTGNPSVEDALLTAPTNDWHLVSLLNDFFNTNNLHGLTSPNLATAQAWEGLLDGMTVFTNSGPGQLAPIVISSNSVQTAMVANGLLTTRASLPTQLFRNVGDIRATPELSIASPFVNSTNSSTVTDSALEAIPSQLISRVAPDSIGLVIGAGTGLTSIQFTGMDGYSYAVQTSPDLRHWSNINTNVPENGLFEFVPSPASDPQFFRSVLQP